MLNLVRTTLFLVIVTLVVQSANAQDKYHVDVREQTLYPGYRTYDIDIQRDRGFLIPDFTRDRLLNRAINAQRDMQRNAFLHQLLLQSATRSHQKYLQSKAFEHERQLNDAKIQALKTALAEKQRQKELKEREQKRKQSLAKLHTQYNATTFAMFAEGATTFATNVAHYSTTINNLPKHLQPFANELLEAYISAYRQKQLDNLRRTKRTLGAFIASSLSPKQHHQYALNRVITAQRKLPSNEKRRKDKLKQFHRILTTPVLTSNNKWVARMKKCARVDDPIFGYLFDVD